MQQKIQLRLLPSEVDNDFAIKNLIAKNIGKKPAAISGYNIHKRSIDARGKTVWMNLTVNAFIEEPFHQRKLQEFKFKNVAQADKNVVIIGAGPAGLFAALQLI